MPEIGAILGAAVKTVAGTSPAKLRHHVHSRDEDHAMATYGKKASDKVEKTMHERKEGTLESGKSGKTVTSRKQAIAIGLSEARKAGAKVPAKKTDAKKKSS
jgi:hypothetical protein